LTSFNVALVEGGKEHGVEVDGPDAVVGFLEPDVLIDERVGDVDEFVPEAESTTGGDFLYAKMPWVFERK